MDNQTLRGKYTYGNDKNRLLLLKVATWYIRGINQTEKLAAIESQIETIAILGMSETKFYMKEIPYILK